MVGRRAQVAMPGGTSIPEAKSAKTSPSPQCWLRGSDVGAVPGSPPFSPAPHPTVELCSPSACLSALPLASAATVSERSSEAPCDFPQPGYF